MKKMKLMLVLCLLAILSTGCVKFNVNMDIKKDKSMNINVIYALDKTMMGSSSGGMKFDDEQIKELEKQGLKVEKYSDGNMEGLRISKSIKNIDEVSTDKDVEYSLTNLFEETKEDNKYLFKVEKGFLKDTYTAKFKFDANSTDLNSNMMGNEEEDTTEETLPDETDDTLTTTGIDDGLTTGTDDGNSEIDPFSGVDYTKMMSSMDMSFKLNLPYGANKSNATKEENGKKNLTWTLSAVNAQTMDVEFSIYNMTIIYAAIAVVAIVLILIIVLIIKKIKNKKNKVSEPIANVEKKTIVPEETVNIIQSDSNISSATSEGI